MPKNAHAHFMLGLMYQRLGQAQKAIASYEKSTEILLQDEEEVRRPDLLSSVRIHHAQCILQASMGDSFDEELIVTTKFKRVPMQGKVRSLFQKGQHERFKV